MNTDITRRDFIAAASLATIAIATVPVWAQAGGKIQIAFVGVAHIHTPSYLDLVRKRPDVHIKYVWDHDRERAERRAKEVGAQLVSDLHTIWDDKEIAAVVILSETNRHEELVIAAVRAGKHLFVEKPLGITGRESRVMADSIEKSGLLFTTGYFTRTDPKFLLLRRL